MCYTREMNADQQFWQVWDQTLQRWGLQEWIASLLEAAGPLTLLGAQAIYAAQPLLRTITPEETLSALARLLEEPDQTQSFVTLLRESTSREPA